MMITLRNEIKLKKNKIDLSHTLIGAIGYEMRGVSALSLSFFLRSWQSINLIDRNLLHIIYVIERHGCVGGDVGSSSSNSVWAAAATKKRKFSKQK